MKVYISGKVSGLPPADTFVKFGKAEFWLREQGHEPVNPLDFCSPDWDWPRCMRECIAEMLKCDAICLLNDWHHSKGAQLEYHVAQMLGLRVYVYRPCRRPGNIDKQ